MNKQKIITGTSVFILLVLFVVAPDAQAQDDIRGFSSSNFKTSNLNTGDGIIDEGWVDVAQQDLSTAFGEGGYAKFANNETHLFALLRATTSLSPSSKAVLRFAPSKMDTKTTFSSFGAPPK